MSKEQKNEVEKKAKKANSNKTKTTSNQKNNKKNVETNAKVSAKNNSAKAKNNDKKVVKKENVKEVKKEVKTSQKEIKALEKKINRPSVDKIIVASIIVGVLVIAFGLFGYYFYSTNAKPVATFDGGSVTTADFTTYYKVFAPMLQYYGYPEEEIPNQIAQKAAIDKIILKEAKEKGISLSDEDRQKVDEIFNDQAQVQQFVEQGIDVARMKELYYNDYTITAYIEKMKEEASDEDVIAYIKENQGEDVDLYEYDTSHILFKTTNDNGEELSEEEQSKVKAKAEEALKRALSGEDFATLAKELSEDAGTKEDGGKFVMYMDGNTYQEYADAVKNLEVGKITTALVKSQAGYHIIKLNAKTENGRAHNDHEREEYVDSVINKLNETKNVEVKDDYLTKLVEKITGKKAETKEDTENTTTTTTDESSTNTEEVTDTETDTTTETQE